MLLVFPMISHPFYDKIRKQKQMFLQIKDCIMINSYSDR